MLSQAEKLRMLLAQDRLHVTPCCYDALSAKLIEQADFELTFMSGFGVSAARLGQPDLGLMSYAEVLDQARNITDAIQIPLIADGDTGYGNAVNVRRTVAAFAKAGAAAIMIEDQLAPKRCGHTPGKAVVSRAEAFDRIRAARDAKESGADILILARTDARHDHGLNEAIKRAVKFKELGADILFVEAPKTVEEMQIICRELPGPKMANIVEGGETPELSHNEIADIGFSIVTYPLTLLAGAMQAMVATLTNLKSDLNRRPDLMSFSELRDRIGFNQYYQASKQYETSKRD
ncbi:2-methylisocitrate lyase-like PEP mutase family enzyme [Roseibium hamelinense]|uniref:2-methylisocitrate lyase-like PEP mutase family enzyme n=1 Tax=Roseibium hamelinense TaxID=150831 RepID=A0A562SNA1_9HYPH|nr:isocitrate lyase/PEP mutase family protein [Roseibium hamelinense]MTI43987.1 isocitrate lyase/PEP mutase family protein [Roseibium hamelinense]TWI82807.1 2-methylisocitrate lyase-like PEP mutase family enzyme [Roseibium hamelinense]